LDQNSAPILMGVLMMNARDLARPSGELNELVASFFCWIPVPKLTMVVSSVAFFLNHLLTNNPQAGC